MSEEANHKLLSFDFTDVNDHITLNPPPRFEHTIPFPRRITSDMARLLVCVPAERVPTRAGFNGVEFDTKEPSMNQYNYSIHSPLFRRVYSILHRDPHHRWGAVSLGRIMVTGPGVSNVQVDFYEHRLGLISLIQGDVYTAITLLTRFMRGPIPHVVWYPLVYRIRSPPSDRSLWTVKAMNGFHNTGQLLVDTSYKPTTNYQGLLSEVFWEQLQGYPTRSLQRGSFQNADGQWFRFIVQRSGEGVRSYNIHKLQQPISPIIATLTNDYINGNITLSFSSYTDAAFLPIVAKVAFWILWNPFEG